MLSPAAQSRLLVLSLVTACLMACTQGVGSTPDANTEASVVCQSATPVFPTFDRSCTQTSDCFAAVHQVDCCGTHVASGINISQIAAFNAAEMQCRGMYPECGCAPRGLIGEDGVLIARGFGVTGAQAECVAGVCRVRVSDVVCNGVSCAPGQVCVQECATVGDSGALPARCVDVPPACGVAVADCSCLGAGGCAHACFGTLQSQVQCPCS